MVEFAKCLRYKRTDYAKKIRKEYESGKVHERRCNMREYTLRNDECSNTLTGVLKDNYILVDYIGCAMRGRDPQNPSYRGPSDGKLEQRLELNTTNTSNAISTVQKDSLVLEIYKHK